MSRYIDADAFLEDESEAYMKAELGLKADRETYTVNMITHFKIQMLIADAPTEDVVSRDQYNACYEECLRLRTQNEQLMDHLREKEDDRK